MKNADIAALAGRIRENIARVVVGKEDMIELLLAAVIARGHVLLEDVPGTGKTVTARSFARSIGGAFSRVQFTPDLLPADISGTRVYRQDKGEFVFHPGPVFANILLADEINRATPRTQSALLECMDEHQVTDGGVTRPLPEPFLVIATQNPIEIQGTFPLPEAQLDRFLVRLTPGYPAHEEALGILDRFLRDEPLRKLEPVCSCEDLAEAHYLGLRHIMETNESAQFNLGSSEGFTVLELIREAERVTGGKIPYEIAERRPGDPATLIAANGKAREVLGWEPKRSDLATILRDAWNWEQHRKY